jgi:hypothetical protein
MLTMRVAFRIWEGDGTELKEGFCQPVGMLTMKLIG